MATQSNFKVKNGLDVGNSLTVDSNATITGTLTLGGNTVDSSWVKARADSDYIKTAVDSAYVKTVQYGDNDVLSFGDNDDLQIYHDGTHSYIKDAGTGNLRIPTSRLQVRNAGNNSTLINALEGGKVALFYNSVDTFRTTATGVETTGEMVADSATINGGNINFDSAGNTKRLEITSPLAQNSHILNLTNNSGAIQIGAQNTTYAHFITDRSYFYFDEPIVNGSNQLSSYNNDLLLRRALVTKLTLTETGATVTGTLNADSSTMTNLTLTGNLQVDGTQTIINSNTLSVNDKNIVLADSATNAAAADSGGITLNGANAKLLYRSSGDKWEFNKAPYYNSARLITTDDNLIDSSLTTQLIDSAYVQARQTEGATRGFAIAMSIAL